MRIFVDADSCPVKEEIVRVAQHLQVMTYFVSNRKRFFLVKENYLYYQWVVIGEENQAFEMYILDNIVAGDTVVTEDYRIANLVLAKKGSVITFRGRQINHDNIEFLLFKRHVDHKVLKNHRKTEENKTFHMEDRVLFSLKLAELLNSLKKEGDSKSMANT